MGHTRRLLSLQYMRGIAALAVVIGHLTWPLTNLQTLSIFLSPGEAQLAIQQAAGTWLPRLYEFMPSSQYFVHCFFLLSGFVIQMSLRSTTAAGFLVQRTFRLYPVLWISSLLSIVSLTVADKALPKFSVVAGEMLLVNGYDLNPVVWTLLIEARFYLATALFLILGCTLRAKTVVLGVALAVLSAANLVLSSGLALHIGTSIFFYLVWMHSGSLVYQVWSSPSERERGVATRMLAIHLLVFVACYLVLAKSGFPAPSASSLDAGALSAALLTLILLVFGEPYFSFRSRLLDYLGNISYPLYLVHIPVGWLVFSLMFPAVNSTLSVIVGFGCVLVVATVLHFYIERPMTLVGKQLAKKLREVQLRAVRPGPTASAGSPS